MTDGNRQIIHKEVLVSQREGFASALGAIAATLGSAVGLGNIWKFPTLTGEFGGAAFLLVYLICVSLIGLPVMLSEFIIGRKTHANTIGAYRKLEPGRPWVAAGWMGVVAAFLIMAFYTDVAGWVFSYVFKAGTGQLTGLSTSGSEDVFGSFVGNAIGPLFWQWVVLITISIIIIAGVQKGIERMTKILLPILFILLLLCDIRALTLPGAWQGLNFLFNPDFSKITAVAVLTAMGLAFFKLSVGMGTMLTYGSYMGPEDNLPGTAFRVMLADTLVSLMAGMAIFPAVFTFGFQPEAGPALLFITIPMVFNSMPFGSVFLLAFFILASIATIGAMISILEVPVAYLVEERSWTRSKATIASVSLIGAIGTLATLSTSVLSDYLVFGKNWFDLFDFTSSNVLMPLGGLIISLYVGWKMGYAGIKQEASNDGQLNNLRFLKVFAVVIKYLTPAAIIVVLLNGLGFFKLIL